MSACVKVIRESTFSLGSIWIAMISILAWLCACTSLHRVPDKHVRNVIVISVDALDRNSIGAFNPNASALTNLDRFARNTVRFVNAFSTASWTLPAHGSLFTGLYPDRHGMVHPHRKMAPGTTTLAQLLEQAGLETVAFTGMGYLSGQYGFKSGFDRYDDWAESPDWRPHLEIPHRGHPQGEGFDRAMAYLSDRREGDPSFFLFIHTFFVHNYFKRGPSPRKPEELLRCTINLPDCSRADWYLLESFYRAQIRDFDQAFGRFLEFIVRAKLDESTLLILTSDHGEGFDYEKQRVHHGGRLEEDVTAVPLMVAGPNLTPGVAKELVSLTDVAPTLLDLLGLPIDEDLDGESFAGSLYGESHSPNDAARAPTRTLFAMEHAYRWRNGRRIQAENVPEKPFLVAVIRKDYYYIKGEGGEALYERSSDRDEERSLIESSPQLDALRDLANWRSQFQPAGATMPIDEELAKRLRALGYIQ